MPTAPWSKVSRSPKLKRRLEGNLVKMSLYAVRICQQIAGLREKLKETPMVEQNDVRLI